MDPQGQSTDVIGEIVRRLVAIARPLRIFLFGSRARGDDAPGADVDLLIVEDDPFGQGRSRREELARLRSALPPLPFAADIVVYSRQEFDRWADARNHLVGRVLREGKLLYERP
ncbi:MAG: nucleotidyltransferase domain-containing protein [Deltaproteobacteria bacterium]